MSSPTTETEHLTLENAKKEAAEQEKETEEANNKPTVQQQQAASGLGEYFDKMTKLYGEDYVKRVIEMANQDKFTIKLNILDPSGKTETIDLGDKKIERPVVIGDEEKEYKVYPMNPLDFQIAEKLRAKFNVETTAKDRDKIIDNQIAVYKFLANCYLKMPTEEFDRLYDWGQLKMAVDACDFKALYRPQMKK